MTETVLEFVNVFAAKCQHNKFTVDKRHQFVECGICGEKLNPIWCLEQLCYKESRAQMRVVALEKAAAKAKDKNRCKCEKCGEFTRIHR